MEENQELESISEEGQEPEAENTTEEQIEAETPAPIKPRNPNAKWYILQAYTGYETRVEQTIREKLKIQGIEELVEEIFIPSEDIVRTKGGKKRKVIQKYLKYIPTKIVKFLMERRIFILMSLVKKNLL